MSYKLDAEQRERANALVEQIIDDPETAAFELIWLRDILRILNQYVADRIVVELADDESEELQTALTYASRSWAKLKTAIICPSCQGIHTIRHHNGTKFECSHCDGSGLRSNNQAEERQ